MSTHSTDSPYFAAIDLGSNSFHMLVARINEGRIETIDREKEMVQLARGMQEDGMLSEEALTRALACLERFAERLRDIPKAQIRAVGTKTLRSAHNSRQILRAAEKALGAPIQIISGYEEARLVYTGFSQNVTGNDNKRLVIDIGGGSTEFIIGQGTETMMMESLALGCVSFSQNYIFPQGEVNEKSMRKAYLAACAELEEIRRNYLSLGWTDTYGTSGTMKAVAELVAADDGGAIITLPSLEKLIDKTIKDKGIQSNAVPKLRREVLPAGLAVLKAIFHQLQITTLHVADATLKEGLIYDTIGRFSDHDSRVDTIIKLHKQYNVDQDQAKRVANLAATLWSSIGDTAPHLPGLSRSKILRWAAELHEVGLSISHSGYHHHGFYILRHSDLAGFGRYEQTLLANLVRAHRKKLNPANFEGMDEAANETFLPLVVCLRLATRLHRRREDLDEHPRITRSGNTYRLSFSENWLNEHPLTHAGLMQEVNYFKALNILLELQ